MESPHSSPPSLRELHDVEDFRSISSPHGLVSIGGYGSLLSERSARWTFPELHNFRVARVHGFRRVFDVTNTVFFKTGIAELESKEIAALSIEPCDGEVTIISVFEIDMSEVPSFIERELGYHFLSVFPEALDGTPYTLPVVICGSSTDEEYRKRVCKGSEEEFNKLYGPYGIRSIWRDDLLPNPVYLRHCVLAAKTLGSESYENFLDHSYLGDRKTTVRHYVDRHPHVMDAKPPPVLEDYPEMEMPHSSEMKELYDLEDFKSISSSDGSISIAGYGSLLSERSARITFPDLQNFRVARIFGFRRVFHVASPYFVQHGYASHGAKDIAAVSAEPCDGQMTIITVFEINESEIPAFIRREHPYRFFAVFPKTLDGAPYSKPVVVCVSSTDEDYLKRVCKGSEEELFNRYGQYGIDRIWSNAILPNAAYLRLCVLAAKSLGVEVYENFLDNTYLGDRNTTIRNYIHDHPHILDNKQRDLD